jgi:hypothetical protein
MIQSAHSGLTTIGVRAVLVLAATLVIPALPGAAQQPGPEDLAADATMCTEIIDSVTAALHRAYVFPDVARRMEDHVRQRMARGQYDSLGTVREFARVLTEDLRTVSHDLHLRVVYVPADVVAQLTAERDEEEEEQEQREQLARANFEFKRVEVLKGNVGYLRFDEFVSKEYAGPTVVAAMNFLAHTDALIIDLRYNGGGEPNLVEFISTYLFDEPVQLNGIYTRETDSWQHRWTLPHVPGPRMTDADVYVLTSDATFSAAEDFSYNLQVLDRAMIIGDTTAGGAHTETYVLFEHLKVRLKLPNGRAENPITGTNWERTGIIPDVVVPPEAALARAHLEALRKMREVEPSQPRRFTIEWIIAGLESEKNPIDVAPELLASYAGTYGPRKLIFEDGKLFYQRGGSPKMEAIPMSERLFRFQAEGYDFFRLEVVIDDAGRPVKVIGHYDDGRTNESPRSEPH